MTVNAKGCATGGDLLLSGGPAVGYDAEETTFVVYLVVQGIVVAVCVGLRERVGITREAMRFERTIQGGVCLIRLGCGNDDDFLFLVVSNGG